jgi:hypothetical protein
MCYFRCQTDCRIWRYVSPQAWLWIPPEYWNKRHLYANTLLHREPLLHSDGLTAVTLKSAVFWVLTPFSLERAWYFGGIYFLQRQSRRVNHERNRQKAEPSYSQTLKMHAICSSETSGPFRTTRRHKSEGRTLSTFTPENRFVRQQASNVNMIHVQCKVQ